MNEDSASTQTAAEQSALTVAASNVPRCPARAGKALPTDGAGEQRGACVPSRHDCAQGTVARLRARRII
ncbi:MAG TPA: hypothetical protein PKA30_06325 [Accumulibacter sp.]|uniref:hypothetical protein n=1 Tax=Accumulibacter sp. TaxID=2053492 RepID=UPI00287A0663|nr:hypothetical protein [Accumulibacter sp.]MDS4055407.1 hypothetical protein [Accumulibacter sp.]HMV05151.1 hypothetical protein [Accumulibacter sp.]HMW62948.1 hypothetical protein [Accumulibacter sp.]HMW81133.1 hypothetical protein [Accumulibacter sp.]HMX68782.1 hypothetical protein [Accumulibacter sp.]